ncbi:MAG TPA: 3-methyladenine DNA glycosylase [Arthrobacter sp.]|nr:3-methyladenine DNA glycosylase [Arthrobacter sp.]
MPPAETASATVLSQDEWQQRERTHQERVRPFADPYLQRRSAGRKHPVEDFLFTYYNHKPGQLRRWHPGPGVVLTGEAAAERAAWKHYRRLDDGELTALGLAPGTTAVALDLQQFTIDRKEAVDFSRIILGRTAARKAHLGCFGLHEWAMVYKLDADDVRHGYLPLRLGADGTDQVVEKSRIKCSHIDAFRFFTDKAAPQNELQPTRETQRDLEQPGCLHANMDLYKWAYKLSPAVPSELLMDCFELSWRIRRMDMQASPYDLAEWGYEPIRIETPDGKAEYVAAQRGFAEEAQILRASLLKVVEEFPDPR